MNQLTYLILAVQVADAGVKWTCFGASLTQIPCRRRTSAVSFYDELDMWDMSELMFLIEAKTKANSEGAILRQEHKYWGSMST